nr:type II toxin-antitoxin system RelE/ParE family toxin [Rhizobium halophytocola]
MDPQTRKRIRTFLEQRLASLTNPRQIGRALEGVERGHLWRYRVGDYRIICDIQDARVVVLVIEIGHRSQVYR